MTDKHEARDARQRTPTTAELVALCMREIVALEAARYLRDRDGPTDRQADTPADLPG